MRAQVRPRMSYPEYLLFEAQSAAWGDGAQVRLESHGVSLDVASLYADPKG